MTFILLVGVYALLILGVIAALALVAFSGVALVRLYCWELDQYVTAKKLRRLFRARQ